MQANNKHKHNKYKYSIYLFFSFILSLIISSTAYSQEKAPYIFMETAQSGSIQYDAKTHSSVLQLKNVEPRVAYFDQKPEHKNVKYMKINDFTNLVQNNINKSPSHALSANLVSLSSGNNTQHYPLTLRNLKYDAKSKTMYAKISSTKSTQFKNGKLFVKFCAACVGGRV